MFVGFQENYQCGKKFFSEVGLIGQKSIAKWVRKESFRMASVTGGGVEFWINITLLELMRWIQDALEAQREDEQKQKRMEKGEH